MAGKQAKPNTTERWGAWVRGRGENRRDEDKIGFHTMREPKVAVIMDGDSANMACISDLRGTSMKSVRPMCDRLFFRTGDEEHQIAPFCDATDFGDQ